MNPEPPGPARPRPAAPRRVRPHRQQHLGQRQPDDGASFRIIADTGDWDRSVGTNTPGQSGDPDSPHYRDLFEPWAEGRYFPVFFSRPKVESVAEAKITLVP